MLFADRIKKRKAAHLIKRKRKKQKFLIGDIVKIDELLFNDFGYKVINQPGSPVYGEVELIGKNSISIIVLNSNLGYKHETSVRKDKAVLVSPALK